MPPISTNLANKYYVTDELVQHYGARAKGGVGLIVSEAVTVEPTYIYLPGDMSMMLPLLPSACKWLSCTSLGGVFLLSAA